MHKPPRLKELTAALTRFLAFWLLVTLVVLVA